MAMITVRTVIILGAGASRPYGFPTGRELRDEVIRISGKTWAAPIEKLGFKYNEYGEFASALARSGYESVDAFLEDRPQYTDIEKAAIALNLVKFELPRALFPPEQPRDHWYEVLWSKMKAPSWAGFKKNSLAIITFNYDRSLEHYLATLVCNNYNIRLATAARGIRSLPILHVHGTLGEYGTPPYNEDPYGRRIDTQLLDIARQSIEIVHESDASSSSFQKANQLIKDANKILFIGFGYHLSNMKKLGILPEAKGDPRPLGGKFVLGTHKGYKADQWARFCRSCGFPEMAERSGGVSMSDFLSRWL